jgi:hypothetical protein
MNSKPGRARPQFRRSCGSIKSLGSDVQDSGVAIGFYNENERVALGPSVVTVAGFEYVLAAGREDESRFLGKTLDYHDGVFCLID